jgi:eukaryotic-like serine/threonine-protein kinase
MDADRRRLIAGLADGARARHVDDRDAFLSTHCGGDASLRSDVESVLKARSAQPSILPEIGTTVAKFRIDRLLGTGGMGAVYLAYDTELHRPVALKVLQGLGGADTGRAQLLREARNVAALSHPNICVIHEVAEGRGTAFIAMEYVEGRSLRERLDEGPLPLGDALRIGAELGGALDYAHEHGVVHRDFKAANVIAANDGRLKIVDFGLARRDDSEMNLATTTRSVVGSGVIAGTPYAMAPEQVRGDATDARTDVWALGILLYEMVAGARPFVGPTITELLSSILRDPPASLPDSVPGEVQAIVRRCLAQAPVDRYQRAGDVRAALEAVPTTASGFRTVRRLLPSRRAGLAAALAVTAALVLVAEALDVTDLRRWADRVLSTDVIAFSERDWLLIASVDNQARDPVFDTSLDTALAVGMGQSSFVNVLSESRINGALRRMKRTVDRIDAETAREIAQREGARLVLIPTIAEAGGVYQLSGVLQDPASGDVLASALVRAPRKQDVLPAADQLIARIRGVLGEASQSILQQTRPLEDVTTSSLDALKLFAAGRAAFVASRIDEAQSYLEQALRIDSSFTAARAQLGMINFELRDRARGKELLARAVTEIGSLTDREKYNVLAFHAAAVEGNAQKAADYYRTLITMYPRAAAAHNNLGRAYMQMSRWDEAIVSLNRALELDPYLMVTYNSLNQIYLYQVGNLDAAIALCDRQIVYNDQVPYTYDYLGWALLGKGNSASARDAFQKAIALNPRETLDYFRLGYAYRLEGRYTEARDAVLKIPSLDPSDHSAFYDAGVASELIDDQAAATAHYAKARQMLRDKIRAKPDAADLLLELAAVLWRLDDRSAAEAAAARAIKLNPGLHFEHATFLALQGRSAEALDELRAAVDGGFRNFVWMKIHSDLESVNRLPAFQELLARGLSGAPR